MWLPKIERDLLAYYYNKMNKPNERETLSLQQITESVFCKEPDKIVDVVLAANERLKERGFIKIKEISSVQDAFNNNIEMELTLQGWDLGRKYSHWFDSGCLWFAEYKNHWLWVILSFLGGIIGGVLVNWLSKNK
jgi:hypothetical protein